MDTTQLLKGVLDFTLGSHFTDELLVAAADEDGVVDDEILWE